NVATPFATFRSCTASLIPDASPSVVATGSAAPAGPENASHIPSSTSAITFPRISPPLSIVAPSVGREFCDANEFGSRGKLSRGASVVDLKFPSSGWRARLGTSMPRGGEFGLGERPLQRHPLLHGEEMAGARHEQLPLWRDRQMPSRDEPAELQQEPVEPAAVERPVAHRPAVEVEKPRAGVPADAAAQHRARRLHRLLVAAVEPDVERPAVDVLAVVGDAKG